MLFLLSIFAQAQNESLQIYVRVIYKSSRQNILQFYSSRMRATRRTIQRDRNNVDDVIDMLPFGTYTNICYMHVVRSMELSVSFVNFVANGTGMASMALRQTKFTISYAIRRIPNLYMAFRWIGLGNGKSHTKKNRKKIKCAEARRWEITSNDVVGRHPFNAVSFDCRIGMSNETDVIASFVTLFDYKIKTDNIGQHG